jgi:hypothetical protein
MSPSPSSAPLHAGTSPGRGPVLPPSEQADRAADIDRTARVLLILIVVVLTGVVLFMLAAMVPKFSQIFSDMLGPGTHLPVFANILINHQAGLTAAVAALGTVTAVILARARRRRTLILATLLTIIPLAALIPLISIALMGPLGQIILHIKE